MKAVCLAILCAVSTAASADFEVLTVTERSVGGVKHLCYEDLMSSEPQCLAMKPTSDALNSTDHRIRIRSATLTDVAVVRESGYFRFGSVVEWTGQSGGLIAFDGPRGRLFALGTISIVDGKATVRIERFSDQSLSEQFDRGVLFGESDPMRLHVATQMWLEQVLLPELEKRLSTADPEVAPRP